MKKEIIVGAKSIDDQLWNLYRVSLDYKYSGDQRAAYIAMTANYTVHWWVGTGRASTPFLKAFVNLSKHRLRALIKKCIAADAGCEDEAIKVIKKYLKVDTE